MSLALAPNLCTFDITDTAYKVLAASYSMVTRRKKFLLSVNGPLCPLASTFDTRLFIHCNENPTYLFLFWELRGLSPNFHIHVSVTNLYIARIGPHISCSRIDRSVVGIYKSLTDTWIWKWGLWPCNSISENVYFQFSVLVLCSVPCQILQHQMLLGEIISSFFHWSIIPHRVTNLETLVDTACQRMAQYQLSISLGSHKVPSKSSDANKT